MRYRQLKASNAYCRRYSFCVRYKNSRKDLIIPRGDFAISLDGGGFICKECAPAYINERYERLVDLAKDIIASGDGEMTDTIIWSLDGEYKKIIGEKNG